MYYSVLPVSETCKKKKTRTLWNKPISQIIDSFCTAQKSKNIFRFQASVRQGDINL